MITLPSTLTTVDQQQGYRSDGPIHGEHALHHAQDFINEFVGWYNHEHRHSGIGLHTPADVFYGLAKEKDTQRRDVLAEARTRHRHRFSRDDAPKIIDLPQTAAINPPKPPEPEDQTTAV